MITGLLIGVVTMSLCLLLQSTLLVQALRYYVRHDDRKARQSSWSTWLVVNGVMMLLLAGNLAQMTIWAIVFTLLGEFDSLGEAAYHSAVNFTTLGYGDIVMSERYKLLGPLEAINGALMIGVSTAALIAALQHSIQRTARSRRGAGDADGAA